MESNAFKNLLTDLYLIYNHDKLSDVDRMAQNYNGKEFDAVKTVYIKYNFRQSPFYDQNLGTDKHVKYLIEKYSEGNRVLSKDFVNVEKQEQEKKLLEIEKIQEEQRRKEEEELKKSVLSEQEKLLNEKLNETNQHLIKQIEDSKKQLELIKRELSQVVEKNTPFDIQLKFNFDDSNLNIPPKENFIYCSIGQRIIMTDKQNGLVAVEIIDILDDYLSDPSKPIREMILEKR